MIGLREILSRPRTIPASGDYSMIDWSSIFAEALPYSEFLDRHANPAQRERWDTMHARLALTPAQQELVATFTRQDAGDLPDRRLVW